MKTLEGEFKKNGMIYRIKERSESRYFAEVIYPDSMGIVGYETGRIVSSKGGNAIMGGVEVKFKAKESIVGNEQFGKDRYEGCFSKRDDMGAYKLFLEGTAEDKKKKDMKGLENKK